MSILKLFLALLRDFLRQANKEIKNIYKSLLIYDL